MALTWMTNDRISLIGIGSWAGAGSRIDSNGAPTGADAYAGPTWRGLNDGVGGAYVNGPPLYAPVSKTLPATRGGTNSNTGKAESLLQELDAE